MHGNLVHMPVKLLHNVYKDRNQKLHLNSRLQLLSTFLPHNLFNLIFAGCQGMHFTVFWSAF